jgi:hypothetical protein
MNTNASGTDNPIDGAQIAELLEVKADSLEEVTLGDIWIAGIPLGKLLGNALENTKENRKHIEAASSSDDGPGSSNGETTTQNDDSDETTPIEKLAAADDDETPFLGGTPGPSVTRALSIYEHFRQWAGSKCMAGWTITENLRKLLSTATGESLAWKQVYRACRKLEEWSQGEIQFKQTDRHGWMLVTENKRIVQRRASSANGG